MMQAPSLVCLRDKSEERRSLSPRCPVLMSSSSQCKGDKGGNREKQSLAWGKFAFNKEVHQEGTVSLRDQSLGLQPRMQRENVY